MNNKLLAEQSIVINAPATMVWHALITPELIKQYLFGTETITDWKVGSPIVYQGVWQGKRYEDKGTIVALVPDKLLETTYWSSMSGVADSPENYKKVTYKLTPEKTGTRLTITQDNNATEEEQKHSEGNWKMVLDGLKKLVESQPARMWD
jgi:uncharacterized protein YndB with AHSA1/START domain